MTAGVLKIVGYVATAVGIVANLVSGYVKDKKMEDIIEKKVTEKLSEN